MKRAWGAAVLLVLAGMTPNCVRLEKPDAFACDLDDDCTQDERCRAGICEDKDSCESTDECYLDGRRCLDGRCVPSECLGKPEACGNFACLDGVCAKACSGVITGCREGNYCPRDSSACVPKLELGAACEIWAECASGYCCGSVGKRCSAGSC